MVKSSLYMEKVRTYDMADLSRASRTLDKVRVDPSAVVPRHEQRRAVIGLAGAMYDTHKQWVDRQFEPLLSYLGTDTEGVFWHGTEQEVRSYYEHGLQDVALAALRAEGIDVQDAIVDYTREFVSMLKTCEKLDVKPSMALALAQGSHDLPKKEFAAFFRENSDLAKLVMQRMEESPAPSVLLREYFSTRSYIETLKQHGHSLDLPKLRDLPSDDSSARVRMERSSDNLCKVEGVPTLRQRHKNWCGVTSLGMLVSHADYPDITPERIFEHTNGIYDPALEFVDAGRGPDINALALAATDLTSLKTRVLRERDYEDLRRKNPKLDSPHAVLRAFLERGIPAMIRMPGHFSVVSGFGRTSGAYLLNNPYDGKERVWDYDLFSKDWASNEEKYHPDTGYLMLIVYPARDRA